MPCAQEEQDRIAVKFSQILADAVADCAFVPTSLCGTCRTVLAISALLTGAVKIHHDAGIEDDFCDLVQRVHAAFIKAERNLDA
ncbi:MULTISPECIES: hypothetical protein [Bradyrhizobium]|uniref:hypothetical protein n=1 Tax=Bradyrhizobium elkanii TaxID=29448 RepID=UPI00040F82AC|nr:hypothetical protein [Bradyrhizobium elkanii]